MAEIPDTLSPGANGPDPESMALTPEIEAGGASYLESPPTPGTTAQDGGSSPLSSVASVVVSPYFKDKNTATALAVREKGTATPTPTKKRKAIDIDENGEGETGEASKKHKSAVTTVNEDHQEDTGETPKKTPKQAASKNTPTKKGKKTVTAKGADRSSPGDESDDAPAKRPQRQRKAAENVAPSQAIPLIFAEAGPADRMLVEWQAAGKPWKEIRAEWIRITGTTLAGSTLPNRYHRILSNCTVIKEEDKPKLIAAKRVVEKEQDDEKWNLIAKELKRRGGDCYEGKTLKLQYQRIMKKEGITGPSEEQMAAGVVDHDFDDGPLPASPAAENGLDE